MSILSTPTAQVTFPAGTADTQYVFVLTGTNPDGTAYSGSVTSDTPSAIAPTDLQVGSIVTLVVTKNGISSLASDPFTVVAQTILLTVPDASQKATITAS